MCTTHWRLTNFLLPKHTAWRPFRAQNINFRPHASVFLLLSIVCRGGVDFAKKIFPPKNLIYGFWRENISCSSSCSPSSSSSSYLTSFLLPSPPTLSYWIPDVSAVAAAAACLPFLVLGGLELLNLGLLGCRLNYEFMESEQKIKSKFSPAVGLEPVKLRLLGRRLIH